MPARVQDIVLQGGDVLLLSASNDWAEKHRHDRSFVLLTDVRDSSPPKKNRAIIGVLLVTGMVLTQVGGVGGGRWGGGGGSWQHSLQPPHAVIVLLAVQLHLCGPSSHLQPMRWAPSTYTPT